MKASREALDELRAKYTEMLRLRLAHDAGDEADPRADLARLASRFPGALREIDELPLETIRARIRALEDAAAEPSRSAPWMAATARFHELTRGVLAAKRWLAGRKSVDDALRATFERDAKTLDFAVEAVAWSSELARVAEPPRGRITALVFERIAAELVVTETEARTLVFGPSRRRGAA